MNPFQGTADADLHDAARRVRQDGILHRSLDIRDQSSEVRSTINSPVPRHSGRPPRPVTTDILLGQVSSGAAKTLQMDGHPRAGAVARRRFRPDREDQDGGRVSRPPGPLDPTFLYSRRCSGHAIGTQPPPPQPPPLRSRSTHPASHPLSSCRATQPDRELHFHGRARRSNRLYSH